MAETIVHAVQGDDVSAKDKTVAGLCHYPGQSQPISGLERGAMEISERTLREVFLPPWEAGIKKSRSAWSYGYISCYRQGPDPWFGISFLQKSSGMNWVLKD